MNAFIRTILTFISILLCSTACALTLGDLPKLTVPANVSDRISSVVYKFVEVNTVTLSVNPVETVTQFTEVEHRSLQSRIVRVDSRVFSSNLNNTLVANDYALFSMSTPNRAINNALSLVSTVSQTPLSNTSTKMVQVLSLIAARKANFEFNYVASINKFSRVESNIDCRFNDTGIHKLAVMARIQYRIDF